MVALLNQYLVANGSLPQAGLGNLNPNLYRLAQSTSGVFHDVTAGNNYLPCLQGSPGCTALGLGYAAGAGYDLTTGLGSVDANQLVTQWSVGPAPAMTLTASPSTAAPTDTVQLTATVTGSGPAPTGSVTFVSNDAVLGTVALSSPGQIGLSVAGAALEAAAGLVTAVYSGDAVYGGAEASTQVALVIGATPGQSFVVPFVTPNPVPLDGFTWSYTVGLTELNGVATTLTGFTINGVSQNLSYWTSTQLPANGKIFASLDPSGLTVPLNRVFAFTGSDAGGHAWSHVLTVPFVSAQGANVSPGMLLSSSPAIVQQNPRAASGCQWEQTLTLQETGGFLVELNGFTEGVSNLSGQIQQYFGTTRLAPFGQLQADVCVAGISPPETQNVAVSGTSEVGTTVAASLNVSYAAAAAAPATFSVSPSAVYDSGLGRTGGDRPEFQLWRTGLDRFGVTGESYFYLAGLERHERSRRGPDRADGFGHRPRAWRLQRGRGYSGGELPAAVHPGAGSAGGRRGARGDFDRRRRLERLGPHHPGARDAGGGLWNRTGVVDRLGREFAFAAHPGRSFRHREWGERAALLRFAEPNRLADSL